MKTFPLYRLIFKSPIKILDLPIHSDTIYSAIYSISLKVDPDFCSEILKGKIVISSCFLFIRKNSGITYYFPKPVNLDLEYSEKDLTVKKELKKLSFIPKDMFCKFINGEKLKFDLKKINEISEDIKKIFRTNMRPKVILDRVTQNSELYHQAELYINSKIGGFYLMAFCEDEKVLERFEGLLKLLGDEGIGGKRSEGHGFFEIEKDYLDIDEPDDGEGFINLSLYLPSEGEMDKIDFNKSAYTLIQRRGWFLLDSGKSFKRKPVWMFKEGSLLNVFPKGCAINVSPDWLKQKGINVYRFGYCLSIKKR
ncbi:MAG: type III-A CRISPR-associated RAMP protein Csm4 [Deltaproteobacteria bacterium]|nr:MAG: type III-A CRISPR-associated RAMP protein Csm4 [Deltaproteobacteria bacterium]